MKRNIAGLTVALAVGCCGNAYAAPETYIDRVVDGDSTALVDEDGNGYETVYVHFRSEPGTTGRARIDGGSWSSASEPRKSFYPKVGSHTVEIAGYDGSYDATPAKVSFTLAAAGSNPPPPPPPPARCANGIDDDGDGLVDLNDPGCTSSSDDDETNAAPPPPPPPGDCTFGAFGPGAWPPACWRPFAATSPFNRSVPSAPALLSGSSEKAGYLAAQGAPLPLAVNNADLAGQDWQHPYFFAKAGDPLLKIDQTRYVGPHEGEYIRVPPGARPAAGGDAHMTVIQPDGQVDDFYDVASVGSGVISAAAHGRDDAVAGDGLADFTTTAAWFSNLAGIIRAPELEAGEINHALFAIVRCTDGAALYPARPGTTARSCSSLGVASGGKSVPLGARLWLEMSAAEIDALAAPAWKKTVLRALARYGAIVGDTGAYGQSFSFGLQFESGTTYTAMGHPDQMAAWAAKQGYTARPSYMGLGNVVDWARRLRVVHPCVSQGSC